MEVLDLISLSLKKKDDEIQRLRDQKKEINESLQYNISTLATRDSVIKDLLDKYQIAKKKLDKIIGENARYENKIVEFNNRCQQLENNYPQLVLESDKLQKFHSEKLKLLDETQKQYEINQNNAFLEFNTQKENREIEIKKYTEKLFTANQKYESITRIANEMKQKTNTQILEKRKDFNRFKVNSETRIRGLRKLNDELRTQQKLKICEANTHINQIKRENNNLVKDVDEEKHLAQEEFRLNFNRLNTVLFEKSSRKAKLETTLSEISDRIVLSKTQSDSIGKGIIDSDNTQRAKCRKLSKIYQHQLTQVAKYKSLLSVLLKEEKKIQNEIYETHQNNNRDDAEFLEKKAEIDAYRSTLHENIEKLTNRTSIIKNKFIEAGNILHMQALKMKDLEHQSQIIAVKLEADFREYKKSKRDLLQVKAEAIEIKNAIDKAVIEKRRLMMIPKQKITIDNSIHFDSESDVFNSSSKFPTIDELTPLDGDSLITGNNDEIVEMQNQVNDAKSIVESIIKDIDIMKESISKEKAELSVQQSRNKDLLHKYAQLEEMQKEIKKRRNMITPL